MFVEIKFAIMLNSLLCIDTFLCRLRSIAAHKDHCPPSVHPSVCTSVRPSVCLSVR